MKEIKATKGYSFIVDDEDYEKVSNFLWYTQITKTLNFFTEISGEIAKTIPTLMNSYGLEKFKDNKRYQLAPEELILNYDKTTHFISYINHDRFDFRKENLKIVPIEYLKLHRASPSKSQFMYRGIGRDKNGTYRATIHIKENGEKKKIMKSGLATLEEAALAYNELAKELYGEYAYLNIIGKDSRQPVYEELDKSFSKRSKKALKAEKGYSLLKGRYYTVQINRTNILTTTSKEEASFVYNIVASQVYGDKADLNESLSDTEFWKHWQKRIFEEPVIVKNKNFRNVLEACVELKRDIGSVYQLLKRGDDIETAIEIAPSHYDTRSGRIRFNKKKFMHECWANDTFEGYYRTEDDAKYAYNVISKQAFFQLPEGFVGDGMVIGRDSTIVYQDKKYGSLLEFANELNINYTNLITHFDNYPLEEVVDVLKKGYPLMERIVVDSIPYYSVRQFTEENNLNINIFNNARAVMKKHNLPCETVQEIYDFIRYSELAPKRRVKREK